jgi:hypothetical protein
MMQMENFDEQLTDSLAAINLRLDPTVKQTLDELTHEYRRGDAGR